jgi:hypothetical protein
MKKVLLILLFGGILLSCNNDDDFETELIGSWKLIEVLSDPGDGSGNFERVNSKKIIEFYADSTLSANGELCVLGSETNATVSGTFSQSDFTINTPNCSTLSFQKIDNNLIITIPCDEPCKVKYRKL